MAAVSLKGVRKTYAGQQEVLKGIDIEIADGEFVVMVGPSGCGKSTLLRMVAGLESITSGTIAIGDRVVNNVEPKDRDIAMVFQNYALYPHMSVEQNMGYALKIAGVDGATLRQRVHAAAAILALEPLLTRKPRELSGGQRQRVAMGRAIVREPAVFLFDEPLSNLDAKLRVQMRLEMQRLHARLGTTSLYVTHDQIEAMTLAQRVIVMNQGRAEQIGAPTEIYDRPATVFVASFIGSPAMNLLPGRVSDDGVMFEIETADASMSTENAPVRLPLYSPLHDDASTERRMPVRSWSGRRCMLGIRPEHLQAMPAAAAAIAVSATSIGMPFLVESCELLGADNLAHGRWAGHDVACRLPHAWRPKSGDALSLSWQADHIHLFDAETSQRLN